MKRNEKNIQAAIEFVAWAQEENRGLGGKMLDALAHIVGRPGGRPPSREGKPTVHFGVDGCDGTLCVWVSDAYSVKGDLKDAGFLFRGETKNWEKQVADAREAVAVIDALPGTVAGYDYPPDLETGEIFARAREQGSAPTKPTAAEDGDFALPANFSARIEQGAAARFVDLRGTERDLYRGCGYHLAAVQGGRIVALRTLGGDMPLDDLEAGDFTKYFQAEILPWAEAQAPAKIWVGLMSCHQFCDPEPLALAGDGLGSALAHMARMVTEELTA